MQYMGIRAWVGQNRRTMFAQAPPCYLHAKGVTEHGAKNFRGRLHHYFRLNVQEMEYIDRQRSEGMGLGLGQIRQCFRGSLVFCEGEHADDQKPLRVSPAYLADVITFMHIPVTTEYYQEVAVGNTA